MTSKLTREERIQSLYDLKIGQVLNQSDIESIKILARMALAAMDSEPVAEVVSIYGDPEAFGEREIRSLVGIQQMPYGTKLYRHAQPAQELKSVGYLFVSEQGAIAYSPTDWGMPGFRLAGQIFGDIDVELKPAPVVPDDVLDALQKVARIRLDLNDFDGDRRGIADCLGDAEEALIEVVNHRAAMLATAPQPQNAPQNIPEIIPGWIPVSERMPEMGEKQRYVLAADFKNNYWPNIPNTQVGVYGDWFDDGNPTWDDGDGEDLHLKEVTHWMPLPSAPQEVQGD